MSVYGEIGFFSLNRLTDWEKGWSDNLHLGEDGLSLQRADKYAVMRTIQLQRQGFSANITDLAVERYGFLYMLDDQANLWFYDYHNGQLEIVLRAGHGLFTGHAFVLPVKGLIMVCDPGGEQRIIALSAANGQILWSVDEYHQQPLRPVAVTAGGEGSLYVATLVETSGGYAPVILKISRSGQITRVLRDQGLMPARGDAAAEPADNISLAVSGSGLVYVMDKGAKRVYVLGEDGGRQGSFSIDHAGRPSAMVIDSKNNIYIGDSQPRGAAAGGRRFIHKFDAGGAYLGPVPGFRGRADKLSGDAQDRLYIWNRELSAVTILELRQRVLDGKGSGLPGGTFISASLDSTVAEMQWHKMILDAVVPDNTQVTVSYFCSDHKEFLINDHLTDLDHYIRDNSVPAPEKNKHLARFWSAPVVNPGDALLHQARGRYIWLKIDLIGGIEHTPLIKKIRLYYPRMSYLSFLPAVYQEDEGSRDFLERFLALFEAYFLDMEEKISGISDYFDADAVSGPYLKWLAAWLGIAVDDSWTEDQLRLLMKRSPELYRKRGTKQALEEIIEIYTGQKPFIIEYFQYKHLRDKPELKELLTGLYSMDPYCFTVLVKQECVATEQRRLVVQKLLDEEKPAFTEARLVVLQPWLYLDMHSYLGVNTYLSELTLLRLDRKSTLPYNTVLVDIDMDNRLGMHSRVEIDSKV